MALSDTLVIFRDQQLPSWPLAWLDGAGNLLDLSGYTGWRIEFVTKANIAAFTKVTGAGGADGTGLSNVIITWAIGELSPVPAGEYALRVSAVDNVSGKRRYMPDEPPIRVVVKVPAITAP